MSQAGSIYLASRSPQRRAILAELGVEFALVEPVVEELGEGDGEPGVVVLENARRKAAAGVALAPPGAVVLGVDTEVVLGERVFGQPVDAEQARAFLAELGGRTHRVLSGLVLLGPGGEGERSGVAETRVSFRVPDREFVERFIASGEWRGRSGGYAIQGIVSELVEAMAGELQNVIGLPVELLRRLAPELFEESSVRRRAGR